VSSAGKRPSARIAQALQARVAALGEEVPAIQRTQSPARTVEQKVGPYVLLGVITAFIAGLVWFWRRRDQD